MAGLTPTGFETPTLQEILDEMIAAARAALGADLDTGPTSVMGQILGILSERELALWFAARDVWAAFTPNGASGESLTSLALITGTVRQVATRSSVTASVTLNAGTTLPAGSRARVSTDTTAIFETLTDVVNAGGSPATLPALMQAVDAGATRANAGTLTTIVTPVVGWTAVTNTLDAEMGSADETDAELRRRREEELRVQGSANLDAIEQDVLQVANVIDARGFENVLEITSGGLPPHSFKIVVWDGDSALADEDEIAQAIWDSKPAGIRAAGDVTGTAVDRHGTPRTIAFDRADELDVYLTFEISVDASTFPADGADQIKNAVVAYADARWRIGEDVILSALYASVFSISGVERIGAVKAGLAPSPSGTVDLAVADAEIARADTSRIVVTIT